MCFIELAQPAELTIRQYLHNISGHSDEAAIGAQGTGNLSLFIVQLSFVIQRKESSAPFPRMTNDN